MTYSAEDLLNDIAFARTSSHARTTTRPREVLKKQKSKKQNNSSRSDDVNDEEHKGFGSAISLGPEGVQESQKAVDSVIAAPRELSSRSVVGVTAQHVKTERGIKVSITIQTQEDVAQGAFASVTAELKRHSRLRELKRYAGDTATFEQHYVDTIRSLKELTPEQGRRVCCGRVHQRGKRAAWVADIMVVGNLDTTGSVLEQVFVYVGSEEYEITMTQDVTPRQQGKYVSTGVWGTITTVTQVPTLASLPRRRITD